MPRASVGGNPYYDKILPIVFEENNPSNAKTSGPSNLPALSLQYLSNLHEALKMHMHSTLKLGHANP